MKQRIQGMVVGSILTVLLFSATSILASDSIRNISVTFRNIRLVVNGQLTTPRDGVGNIVEPFIFEGTTYLPVRAVGEALGMNVSWNSATSTVYISTPTLILPSPSPVAFFEAVPHFESGGQRGRQLLIGTVNMLGMPYPNALHISFPRTSIAQWDAWKNFSLNEQFETLTGTIGRVDGTGVGANSISFIGDGRTLATFVIDGDTHPTDISVDVRGVRILRIQFDESTRNANIAFANAMIE